MKNIIVLLGCSAALLCMELYSLWPYSEVMHNPFPFSKQELSWQSYVDYAATRAGICILFAVIWYLSGKQWQYLALLLLICGYFVDYLLIYNEPFGYSYFFGHRLPVSYTLFMIISAGVVIFKSMIEQWRK